MLSGLSSKLYQAARKIRDLEVWTSGDPGKILRRIGNKIIIKKGTSKARLR